MLTLAKIIKENMNEQLGLMTYASYDYNHYEDRYQSNHTYQRNVYLKCNFINQISS